MSDMMNNYVIWKPERNGHAPPFWKDGMVCQFCIKPIPKWRDIEWGNIRFPYWHVRYEYRVPSEAVNGPAADDARDNAEFDVQAWLAEGRANLERLPAGVVLPESPDWADKLAKEWRETPLCEAVGLADFLRTHCQPREVSNG
jgi:hypothetical protein